MAFGRVSHHVFEAGATNENVHKTLENICQTYEPLAVGIIEGFNNLPLLLETVKEYKLQHTKTT